MTPGGRLWRCCAALLLLGIAVPGSGATRIVAGSSDIVFNDRAGVPLSWTLCQPDCADPAAHRTQVFGASDGYLSIATPTGPGGAFSAQVSETAAAIEVRFTAALESYTYRVFRDRAELVLELPPNASVQLASGAAFIPAQLPGFGQIYSRVKAAVVSSAGQTAYDDPDMPQFDLQLDTESWAGVRSRYWGLLAQPVGQAVGARLGFVELDRPVVTLNGAQGTSTVLRFYAGPLQWQQLREVADVLPEMLFAALWDWLRALCFGMLWLLDALLGVVGNPGAAIVLLSLTVKLLMYPLTAVADRWQEEVNRTSTLLKPELDAIKRDFRGEEAHERTLAVYRNHGVSPTYTFKSLAGVLIQIPVFIAAFDMLAENILLNETPFLWIADLARPDALASLPVTLPFFGGAFNLLPLLMAGLSVAAALRQREAALSADLQRQQSVRLMLMSAAFLLLFYTFPAGMVLYWTANNLFHLLKLELARILR